MSQYNLLFGFKLCERILKITDNLNRTLQKQSLSAVQAQTIADLTVKTLKGMRTDEAFDLFFKLVQQLSDKTNTAEPSLPRKRKAPKHFEVGDGDRNHSPTVMEYYRRQYFEALDLATSSIHDRFDQPGYAVYKNLEALLFKAANKRNILLSFNKSFPPMETTLMRVSFQHS